MSTSLISNTFSSIWSYRIIRILLGAIFVYAGIGKLLDVHGFALVIEEYGIVSGDMVGVVALGLPGLEVIGGAALVANRKASLWAVFGMTLLFLAVLVYAIAAGLTIADCGCFAPGELPEGVEDGSALWNALFRDLGLMSMCAYLFWWRSRNAAEESSLEGVHI